MTDNNTPAATPSPIISVQRGAGVKVHRALTYQGRIIGTWCVGTANARGRADLTLRQVPGPVDCKKCSG